MRWRWWMYECKGWDDRLPGAFRRLYCEGCQAAGRVVRPRAEITREQRD